MIFYLSEGGKIIRNKLDGSIPLSSGLADCCALYLFQFFSAKHLKLLIFIFALSLLVGCQATAAPRRIDTAEPVGPEGVIVLGKVSDKPAEKIEEYQPIANYLAANLSDYDIGSGLVKVAPDIQTMADWLAKGEVDLFIDNPYAGLIVAEQSGGQAVFLRVKEGDEEKRAVFFTLADSELKTIDDLNGYMVALEEAESASGFLLPMAYLIEAGLRPVEKTAPNASVSTDEVGYVLSGDDNNTIQWIIDGRIAAGVVDNEAFEEYSQENPGLLSALAETEPVLRHQLTVATPDLDPDLLATIKTLLLNLHTTEAGPGILAPSETERFDDFESGWKPAFMRVKEMYTLLKAKP